MKFTINSATPMMLWLLLPSCHNSNKAIDLIDEAGSRVRLRHAQLPEEARELEKELRQITKEKNEAVCGQDFEKAGELCDREMDLRTQISTLVDKNKEMSKEVVLRRVSFDRGC
ncbi:putative UVR domain, clpA/ClpB, AAA lid domain-containing protein [Helianthus debilis subsp. tardiflorus]